MKNIEYTGMSMYYKMRYACTFMSVDQLYALNNKHRRILKEMGRNDLCFCGSGKKHKKCHHMIREDSLLAHTLMCLKDVNKKIQQARAEQGFTTICEMDQCYDCCRDYFCVSLTEYFLIKATLLSQNKSDFFENCVDVAKNQLDRFKVERLEDYRHLIDTKQGSKYVQPNDKDIRCFDFCPFLNEEGLCEGYEARPILCRIYGNSDEYGMCNKIEEARMDGGNYISERQILIGMKDMHNVNIFPMMKNGKIYRREGAGLTYVKEIEKPIFYWLARDEDNNNKYNDACNLSLNQYLIKHYSLD